MASSYSMRKRSCPRTPETKPQLFKVFQQSPDSSIPEPSSSPRKKQIKSNKSRSKSTSVQPLEYLKGEAKPSQLNHSDLLNQEFCSSSINDSSLIREKNPHLDLRFQRAQDNNQSMKEKNNSILIRVESKKMLEKNSMEQFQQEKNSYRNHRHSVALGVPYRKCHSSMEEKIVNIINKIKLGKECLKQIQTLIQRSKKVSTKELSNRYFISGLHVILKLLQRESTPACDAICVKIEEVIEALRNRIFQELDCIKTFQATSESSCSITIQYEKGALIRKAYRILKQKNRQLSKQRRQKQSISLSQKFLEKNLESLELFWMELRNL